MEVAKDGRISLLVGLVVTLIVGLALPITSAGAKKKIRNPGPLTLATQSYRVATVDKYERLTVECPGSLSPYGGGFLYSPPPGTDGDGLYPNSYERLGVQHGYHITATLIDPQGNGATPRDVTMQVLCGKKIGKTTPPHQFAHLGPGGGPKAVVATCPKNQTLIGGGYQQTDALTDGGVVATESHRTSPRTWKVVAHNIGVFAGMPGSIAYCVPSRKSLITEVSASVAVPSRMAATVTTPPCPSGRQLDFGGFSTPPSGGIRFMGAGFVDRGTWAATGFNSGSSGQTALTAYGYCLRA